MWNSSGGGGGERNSSGHHCMSGVSVIHLQFWAYGSWDSLFPISMSPNCKLMSPKHYFK